MLKFLSHLLIPVTIKPVTCVISLATIATNAPSINAPRASAGSRATIPTGVLSAAAPFLPPRLTLPQLPPIDLPDLHDVLHSLLLPLSALTRPTPNLTARGTGNAPPFQTRMTLTFTRTSVEMESSIVLDGATLQDPLVGQTLGIFEPSSMSQG